MRRSTAPSLRLAGRGAPGAYVVDSSTRPAARPVQSAVRDTHSILGLLDAARSPTSGPQLPSSSCDAPQPADRVFSVVWGKPSRRKHKTWQGDGMLHLSDGSALLKDADGKELGRAARINTAVLECGSHLSVAGKEVELVELVSVGLAAPQSDSPPAKRRPVPERPPAHRPLVMPQPSQEHQWHHNVHRGPVATVSVDGRLCRVLRPHQREGVVFLYECVTGLRRLGHHGAVLADEMGLGKTLQAIALIWTLLRQGVYGRPEVRRVLVVTPSSLVANWHREFQRWLPHSSPISFPVDQKNKPEQFGSAPSVPVMIISYERFVRCYQQVSSYAFDLLICDEGHRLKNFSVKASVLLSRLPCLRRVLLTGTPIQNHLQEFYAIVSFVNPGVLGPAPDFQQQFERAITAGRQPEASAEVRALGKERAAELGRLTSWFILRRTQDVARCYLQDRHEAVILCTPSSLQRCLYQEVVGLWEGRAQTEGRPPHLEVMVALRKICNHPCLLRPRGGTEPSHWQERLWQCVAPLLEAESNAPMEQHSGKLQVLVGLLEHVRLAGEKLVLVSSYTQTLNLLADVCKRHNLAFCRLDGSTPSDQRLRIVDTFNSRGSGHSVFLLSARAGGVGLNLTGASRLVLYDCDWNPATDRQAMARVWRDGQTKAVHLYRLLTAGTIEEKMFQRQMSKTGLRDSVVDPSSPGTVRLSDQQLKGCGPDESQVSAPSPGCEGRQCQLGARPATYTPGIDQLGSWQHLAPPFPAPLLQEMALGSAAQHVTFMFRSSSSSQQV